MRVSLAEKKAFQKAARKENQNVSDWIRSQLLSRVDIETLPPLSRFDDAIRSIQTVRKEFENWGNTKVQPESPVTKDNLNKVTCEHCGKTLAECQCAAVVELKQAIADQVPEAGKEMVPDGTEGEPSIRDVQLPVMCERCEQPGHMGEDCPEPMHFAAGKWVKD